jgi:hypothetical protein
MLQSFRSRLCGLAAMLTICWAAAQAGAADLKYLPEDTGIVFTINFRQIVDSPLVKGQKDAIGKIKALVDNALGENEEAQKYLKATGFDLFRDLTSVTVAHPGDHDKKAALAIIEGDFNPEKFHAAAADAVKDHGDFISISKVGEHKIIEVSAPNDHAGVVVMVNKNLILAAASKDRVLAALARAGTSEKGKLKKELKSLLETTSAKQSISAVATGAALTRLLEKAPVPNAQAGVEVLKKIDGLSGAITILKDVQFQMGVATKDEETANLLAKQANQFIPLGKFLVMQQANQDQKLLPVVDVMNTLRATVQGTSFLLRGEVTVENIDKLMKNFPK